VSIPDIESMPLLKFLRETFGKKIVEIVAPRRLLP